MTADEAVWALADAAGIPIDDAILPALAAAYEAARAGAEEIHAAADEESPALVFDAHWD